jgi:protein prenyltransferase alpha subunit repeat containing protein 1
MLRVTLKTPITGEQLFEELNRIFRSDPAICELGFLMSIVDNEEYAKKNEIKSPFDSAFLLYEHKLGLCFSYIPALYGYVHSLFAELRQQPTPQSGSLEAKRAIEVSRAIVLINADNYSCWNYRKRLINEGIISEENEIEFMNFLFTKHMKSSEAWSHRRWVINRLIQKYRQQQQQSQQQQQQQPQQSERQRLIQVPNENMTTRVPNWLDSELTVCSALSASYPRNYMSWTHRLWLFQQFATLIMSQEQAFARQWTTAHPSDYSGYHYLFHLLIAESSGVSQQPPRQRPEEICLKEELRRVEEQLRVYYAEHESLWNFRRALLYVLITRLLESEQSQRKERLHEYETYLNSLLQWPLSDCTEATSRRLAVRSDMWTCLRLLSFMKCQPQSETTATPLVIKIRQLFWERKRQLSEFEPHQNIDIFIE